MKYTFKKLVVMLFVALIGFASISATATAMMTTCDIEAGSHDGPEAIVELNSDQTDHHALETATLNINDCISQCDDMAGCLMSSCSACGVPLTYVFNTQIINSIANSSKENSAISSVDQASPYRPPQA